MRDSVRSGFKELGEIYLISGGHAIGLYIYRVGTGGGGGGVR